ncbi:hypothetical protein SAMN05444673_6790 [Bacillus sp. OV166]|nr:hypothetical protein SAMN05444673_6790 [Bacillus sp. OV166]
MVRSLPQNQKYLLWDLIIKCSSDGITIFYGDKRTLTVLLEKNLIMINSFYKAKNKKLVFLFYKELLICFVIYKEKIDIKNLFLNRKKL